jgi:hypothetical protein
MKLIMMFVFSALVLLGLYLVIFSSIRWNFPASNLDKFRRSLMTGLGTILFCLGLFLGFGTMRQENTLSLAGLVKISCEILVIIVPLGILAAIGKFMGIELMGNIDKTISNITKKK